MSSNTGSAVAVPPDPHSFTKSNEEDEEAQAALNTPSPGPTDTNTPSQLPENDSGVAESSSDSPQPGRKRRLSFKEKQRQNVSHFGSSSNNSGGPAATWSALTVDPTNISGVGTVQSPTSTASSTSPHPLDISPSGTQSLQPARKRMTADMASSGSPGGASGSGHPSTTSCVFSALEPTRGGPRGAARPPNRSAAPYTASARSGASVTVSPPTSTEASPMQQPQQHQHQQQQQKPSSPPDLLVSPSTSLVHSPLTQGGGNSSSDRGAVAASGSGEGLNTSASPSPLTLPSSNSANTNSDSRDVVQKAPEQTAGGLQRPTLAAFSSSPSVSMDAVTASSPKVSVSSASSASPKMSFKDRQRAAAAAAAAATGTSSASCNPSTRTSVSSPFTECGPTAAFAGSPKAPSASASHSFLTRSPNPSLSVAEPSVNQEQRRPIRNSPLPVTALVKTPTQQGLSSEYPQPAGAGGGATGATFNRGSSSLSGNDSKTREGSSPLQSIPRLPIDRIRSETSAHASFTTSPSQEPQKKEESPAMPPDQLAMPSSAALTASPPALNPLDAPYRPTSKPSTPTARSTQSAPAAAMHRRGGGPNTANPLAGSSTSQTGSTEPSYTMHPTAPTTTTTTHTTTTNTTPGEGTSRSSQGNEEEYEEDDEENVALNFTHNATKLQLYDPNEPSPQVFMMAVPRSQSANNNNNNNDDETGNGNGGGGGTARTSGSESGPYTRSGTFAERSINSARLAHSQRSFGTEEEAEGDARHTVAGGAGTSSIGAARSGSDRRTFGTRRARTGSLGSPPPHATTVPPSPSPGIPFATSPSSHSPRKMPTPEHAKFASSAAASGKPKGTVVGHWKQHTKPPPVAQHTASLSGSQELHATSTDGGEHSMSAGDIHLSSTSRSRARRHRDKMLAPDGAVLSTPRTGRGPGGEAGVSAFANIPPPRLHNRSHTVDDFALYNAAAGGGGGGHVGHRGRAVTPSTVVSPGSVLMTAHPTPGTVVPPAVDHTVVAVHGEEGKPSQAVRGGGGGHAGPLDASQRRSGPSLPLSVSTNDTMLTSDIGGIGRRRELSGSPRSRTGGLVTFPSLPPLHDHTATTTTGGGGNASALSRVSQAMAAVLSPSGPSAENVSAATPVTVATPVGYRSGDENSNDASHGNQTEVYDYTGQHMDRHQTMGPEDLDTAEGDYLLQTYNTYYGGENSLSATTAELRKSRRRSNYSSLHYGTMTGYHHRRADSRRPRSGSAAKKGTQQQQRRQQSQRSAATTTTGRSAVGGEREEDGENEEDGDLEARLDGTLVLDERSNTVVRQGAHSSSDNDDDDAESVCEQKGSEEDRERAEALNEEGRGGPGKTTPRGHHRQHHAANAPAAAATGSGGAGVAILGVEGPRALADDEEDEGEAAQRRRVGMWATIEHVFLPKYELVPEAASNEPLTGPCSPSSANPSGTASTGKPEAKPEGSSPINTQLKSNLSSPKTLSTHGLHQNPAVMLSPPAKPASPVSNTAAPAGLPPSRSVENSPSLGPSGSCPPGMSRPSGLVVLPDAANINEDPGSSASLTYSQFRKTPAQMAGTKRLEPEKFSFGTVAANYNMEPVDEQQLPDGACDAKVAARLIFDATAGVMLMDPEDEGGRYEQHQQQGRASPSGPSRSSSPRSNEESTLSAGNAAAAAGGGEDGDGGDGACRCEASFIAKDFKGLDCSRYDASELYDHCSRCHRRPAAFLCLHCLEAVCPSHVRRHHLLNPTQCTLFLNLLDIMSSFDRIFWCEKCQQFTWKYTEIYDSLVDQIAYTRGTYLKHPARDIHCVGYEMRLKDATQSCSLSAMNVAAAAAAGSGKAQSEPSIGEDFSSSNAASPARFRRVVSGSSLNAALQSIQPNPPLVTFPTVSGSSLGPTSPQLRSNTPPVNVPRMPAPMQQPQQPSMLGVNNLIVFGASPSSPMGGNGAASRLHSNAVGTPSLHPLKSPMQNMLSRDPMALSTARAVTVGEPVTKLCALGASVQGWRTTQEDAEAVFLIDIPALSNEVVNRKEMRAVAAAAAEKKKQKTQGGERNDPASAQANEESQAERQHRSHTTPLNHSVTDDEEKHEAAEDEFPEEKETIPMGVFCVFDGHGGDAVAKLAARHFEAHLRRAIAGTRADDVRARALLFYLNAESNAAALAGPSPAVTAIPAADGSVTFLPSHSPAAAFAAAAAAHRAASVNASSPPPFLSSPPIHSASPHSGNTGHSSSSHRSRLLVPGNSLPQATSADDASSPKDREVVREGEEEGDTDMPQILQLPDAMGAESIPVVLPVTTESLRLHMAASAVNMPVSGEGHAVAQEDTTRSSPQNNANRPPRSVGGQENVGLNAHGLAKNRRSKTGLDAWADMEEPPSDVAATAAAAAAAAASASPMMAKLMNASFGGNPELRHYGGASPQAAMAASTAFCPSPSALVSIPEMEMLRQYFASIMEDALLSLDDYLRNTPEGLRGDYDCVGCTACVVGITANFVLCANVGDSGAAFYTKDRIKVISVKHRVSDEAEQKRINAAGYSIVNDRIEGMSAVPRALGDFDFKQCGGRGPHEQAVSAVPDVTIMPVPSDTDLWGIILACDGVWDTATLHQVHVALTNTVNDLDVASSATDAVLRGAELFERHVRGPAMPRDESPSSTPHRSMTSVETAKEGSGGSPSPPKRRALSQSGHDDAECSLIGWYDCDERDARRLPQVDPILLTAAAGVFAQCVAPADNDEGVGLDNCSLILVERRNVQE